jgi:hypothetical protein
MYMRHVNGIFGREITKYTVIWSYAAFIYGSGQPYTYIKNVGALVVSSPIAQGYA